MYVPPVALNFLSTAVWNPEGHLFFMDLPKRFFLLNLPLLLTVVSFVRLMSLLAFLGSVTNVSPRLRKWLASSFIASCLLTALIRHNSECLAFSRL